MVPKPFAVEAQDLTKYYGKLLAVDHISFQVPEGEVFGFLGPNGAGKTTTLKMLNSLLQPDQGTAKVCGYDINRQPYDAKRQFGVVHEDSNVYTELTTWENLMFTAQVYRIPRGERNQRVEQLLEQFGLAGKRREKVFTLSKGMRQRLSLAMALIHEPKVLFLDEPIMGLDVQSSQMIKDRIRRLNAGGTTIFLTTHQIEMADELCHRVAIINQGQIAAVDSPVKLKDAAGERRSVEVTIPGGGTTRQYCRLAELPGVKQAIRQGEKIRLYTAEPPLVLQGVMAYAQEADLHIQSINTLGPSLEDVFVAVTGQGLGAPRAGHSSSQCKVCPVKDDCDSEPDSFEDEEAGSRRKKFHHSC